MKLKTVVNLGGKSLDGLRNVISRNRIANHFFLNMRKSRGPKIPEME